MSRFCLLRSAESLLTKSCSNTKIPAGSSSWSNALYSTNTTSSNKMFPPLLGRFRTVPIELFRINAGADVRLRDCAIQAQAGRSSFDLHVGSDGLVHPKPGEFWEGPNGASLRPNGPMLQKIVKNFKAHKTIIYRIPKDTIIPDELVLLHEHSDHYSLQCTEAMQLSELNTIITAFLQSKSEQMTKSEFIKNQSIRV